MENDVCIKRFSDGSVSIEGKYADVKSARRQLLDSYASLCFEEEVSVHNNAEYRFNTPRRKCHVVIPDNILSTFVQKKWPALRNLLAERACLKDNRVVFESWVNTNDVEDVMGIVDQQLYLAMEMCGGNETKKQRERILNMKEIFRQFGVAGLNEEVLSGLRQALLSRCVSPSLQKEMGVIHVIS